MTTEELRDALANSVAAEVYVKIGARAVLVERVAFDDDGDAILILDAEALAARLDTLQASGVIRSVPDLTDESANKYAARIEHRNAEPSEPKGYGVFEYRGTIGKYPWSEARLTFATYAAASAAATELGEGGGVYVVKDRAECSSN